MLISKDNLPSKPTKTLHKCLIKNARFDLINYNTQTKRRKISDQKRQKQLKL